MTVLGAISLPRAVMIFFFGGGALSSPGASSKNRESQPFRTEVPPGGLHESGNGQGQD